MITQHHLRYAAVLVIALGFLLLTWSWVNAGDNGGNALNFGGDSHVVIAEGAGIQNLGLGSFTLEAWVYPTDNSTILSIIRNNHDYNLIINVGQLRAEVFPGGDSGNGDFTTAQSNSSLTINQWYHVAAVWNGSSIQLYVNGNQETSSSGSGNFGTAETLWIGYDQTFSGQGFRGAIDEVRIYTTSLTSDEIRATMFQTVAVTTTNLAAYWPFDEGSGTSTADATGHGYDGTLGSSPNNPTWISSTAPLGSLNSAYQNDIAGMWSSITTTMANGGLNIADVDFLQDTGDDIIFGHNGSEFHSGVTTNLSPTLNAKKRWARLWQLDVNDVGTTGGNVDLTFDISEAGGSGSFSQTLGNYYLLRRPTSSADDFAEATVVSSSVTGDQLTFRVAVTELGSEFTVGADNTSPSAVAMQDLAARSLTDAPDIKLVGLVLAIGLGVVALAYRRHRPHITS